jgi:hypothetical protein
MEGVRREAHPFLGVSFEPIGSCWSSGHSVGIRLTIGCGCLLLWKISVFSVTLCVNNVKIIRNNLRFVKIF